MAAQRPPNQWQCHVCHGGPYLYVNTTRCTNIGSNNRPCNHDFCRKQCKVDNDIPPPLSSAQFWPPAPHSAPRQGSPFLRGALPRPSTNLTIHNDPGLLRTGSGRSPVRLPFQSRRPPHTTRSHLCSNDVQCGSRPSMAGWWRCGRCRQMNNPALHTGRCWSCGHHGPCRCCTHY